MRVRIPDLVVDGMPEQAILADAPVMTCDRLHWDGPALDLHALAGALPMRAWTRQWSDGRHRIWVEQGLGPVARERIAEATPARGLRIDSAVSFRDLDGIPRGRVPALIEAAVAWLYPRTLPIRRKLVADLDLVEDEDVRPMMYLFVWDHLDRFAPRHGGRMGPLILCAFLLAKMRTWPQDASRAAYGRTVVDDQQAVNRAFESFVHAHHRVPTEAELAQACGVEVAELRRRRRNADAVHRRHRRGGAGRRGRGRRRGGGPAVGPRCRPDAGGAHGGDHPAGTGGDLPVLLAGAHEGAGGRRAGRDAEGRRRCRHADPGPPLRAARGLLSRSPSGVCHDPCWFGVTTPAERARPRRPGSSRRRSAARRCCRRRTGPPPPTEAARPRPWAR